MNAPPGTWKTAYLGLGANLGDREASILAVLAALDSLPTIEVTAVSSLYETVPVGMTDQPDFLNAVAQIQTSLRPEQLLQAVLHLETERGRVRNQRWGPRVIDVDILVYGDQSITLPGLTVPHPRLEERAFALVPLAEVAPEMVLPGRTAPVKIRAEELRRSGNILGTRDVKEFRT
jgi:2-amino-4-hydroxy-6-hydroxymethyldihydropteridine diphosphokinase